MLPKFAKVSHSLIFFLNAEFKSSDAASAIFCTKLVLICPHTHKLISNSPRFVCKFSPVKFAFSKCSAFLFEEPRPEKFRTSSIAALKINNRLSVAICINHQNPDDPFSLATRCIELVSIIFGSQKCVVFFI